MDILHDYSAPLTDDWGEPSFRNIIFNILILIKSKLNKENKLFD